MLEDEIRKGLTFDDVLLLPAESRVLPRDVQTKTLLTREIMLAVPFLSSAMDTVTESAMAIAMAQIGGIGIIHRNMSPEKQAKEVIKVKRCESGMVAEPVTIGPRQTIAEAENLRESSKVSGFPVLDGEKLVGILTNRDLRSANDRGKLVSEIMTPRSQMITAQTGVDKETALRFMHENRVEKLPVVDSQDKLIGLITLRDLESDITYPGATKDSLGRFRVGAAVGVAEGTMQRVEMLAGAGVDLVVVDTAHGHSKGVLKTVKNIKAQFKKLNVVAGNIATADGAKALIEAGADAIKVGVGPGSICTTRIVAGVGVPQVTAIADCAKVAVKKGIPVIGDGGIKYSGDIVKAIAAGADCVMMGSVLAGTEESPGEVVIFKGRSYKLYRGMGSIGAMSNECRDRYSQEHISEAEKLVPEGIEGRVPCRGKAHDMIYQFLGGLKSGMGYTGCATIAELKERARFVGITAAGLRESHVHDVIITKEAPNYRGE